MVIFSDVDIEFQRADTEFERFGESPQRLAGGFAAAAGVGLQVKPRWLWRCRGQRRGNSDGHQQGTKARGPSSRQFR
jgi:hypothetical protein